MEVVAYYALGYALVSLVLCLIIVHLYDKGIFRKLEISDERLIGVISTIGASAIVHFSTAIVCALIVTFKNNI